MRFASFTYKGAAHFGTVEGETVRPFGQGVDSLYAYLALGADRAKLAPGEPIALADVALLVPVLPRRNVFCVGRNYMGHAEEVARASGKTLNLPKVPTFFTKATTAIVNPGEDVSLAPDISNEYDWEAELAVVIGERCRDVSEADALSVVFGYTCLNDVTARDLQRDHQQWFKGKSLDGTCPIGPWIVSADDVGDPQTLDIALRVDGETKQNSNTKEMIFSVRQIIASLSRGMTLEPGDVIATGTPDGVGMARKPPEFLYDGATMEVEIAKIGVLRNAVRFRKAAA